MQSTSTPAATATSSTPAAQATRKTPAPGAFLIDYDMAGTPVQVEYEVQVNEDERGRDTELVATRIWFGSMPLDADLIHPEERELIDAAVKADFDGEPDVDEPSSGYDDGSAAAAAEDAFIAARDHAHYSRVAA